MLVFVIVAPAVIGLAVCVELDDMPGMIGAAAGARDDTSCTGLITERLHALSLGFNTVSPVLLVVEVVVVVAVLWCGIIMWVCKLLLRPRGCLVSGLLLGS